MGHSEALSTHTDTDLAPLSGLKTELFFDRHYESLQEVFNGMELQASQTKTLEGAVASTQPWIKGDHSRPGYNLVVSPEDSDKFHAIYGQIGMKHEIAIPAGKYDDVVVLGAVHLGNRRRTDLLVRSVEAGGVIPEHISLLGGQRHLYPEKETDDIQTTLSILDAKDWHNDWSRNIRTMEVGKMWETDAMRLAVMEKLGPLVLERLVLRNNDSSLHDKADPIFGYEFSWKNVPITLMHALAVDRPNGERRHNTDSCIAEYLERQQPPEGAQIAFINGNPHTERMGRTISARLRAAGRGDLRVAIAGSAVSPTLGHGHYLRELAANLYEDQRLVKAAA